MDTPVAAQTPLEALAPESLEISVVIPCLNEAETIGRCVEKALEVFRAHSLQGEVVVADNGSTDASAAVAVRAGARVVPVPRRGYGNAIRFGIASARGRYILMGDADASYDFGEIPRFLEVLRGGATFVQGCRLPSGGGHIEPLAMPWSHRYLGNPVISSAVRTMFALPLHDVNCGLRAFERTLAERFDLRCEGMELAVEMLVKAQRLGATFREIPITLHRDGRTVHGPHLRRWRDGMRTLSVIARLGKIALLKGMVFLFTAAVAGYLLFHR